VSTKTGTGMGLFARKIVAIRFQEGLTRKGAPHCSFVGVFFEHSLSQNPRYQARGTRLFSSRLRARPSRNLFIKPDGDFLQFGAHNANMACDELGVNFNLFNRGRSPNPPRGYLAIDPKSHLSHKKAKACGTRPRARTDQHRAC
jgi:hypothetical protein